MTTRSSRATAAAAASATAPSDPPFPPMFPGGNRIGREEEEAVLRVIRDKRLFRYYGVVDGPSEVEAFEEAFAATLGARHAVAVGSGTLALMAALAAAGVGLGDQVIVPAYTWVSTAAAVLSVGAVPVICEVDESLTMDPVDVETRITDRTRAVIPVHMRGAAADMDAIGGVARRHGLIVIEDAAQAIGGSYRGRRLGTIGHFGCFSLQYNKIITCGEGGVVVTDDPVLHDRVLMYHDVAASQRQDMGETPVFYGTVARMSELQGAVARVQLDRLDDIVRDCRSNRDMIEEAVADDLARQGIRVRPQHDEAGDTGIALVLLCPDASRALRLDGGLRAARLPARVLFDPEREDLHIAYHWGPLLQKRSWSQETPWDVPKTSTDDRPMDWPRTVDVLGRAVHIDVSPDLTESHLDRLASSIRNAITES